MRVIVIALMLVVAEATAGNAACVTGSAEDALVASEVGRWVTTSGTHVSRESPTRDILDERSVALSGSRPASTASRAYPTSCGPMLTTAQEQRTAESLVGRSFLLRGMPTNGVLSLDPTVLDPSTTGVEHTYRGTLVDLRRTASSSDRRVVWLLVAMASVLVVCSIFVRGARTSLPGTSGSEEGDRRAGTRPFSTMR
jgi:hypothetical protein